MNKFNHIVVTKFLNSHLQARVLSLLHKWILEAGEMPEETSFSDAVVLLFFDQDDAMVEAMLCLIDIYSGFQAMIFVYI